MKNIFVSLFGLLLVMSIVSCDDYLDINQDPNNPGSVPATLTLPSAQMTIATTMATDYAVVGGLWAQHWAQSHVASQYRDEDRYDLTLLDYQTAWSELFAGALTDLKKIEAEIKDVNSPNYQNWNLNLQAVCLTAFTYQLLVDWYDKVPYSEALNGESGNFAPIYDDGKVIYDDLIRRIDEALAKDFTASTVKQISSDFLFGSLEKADQVDAWKQFANTLKLKLWLRQTKHDGAATGTAITALLANGNFLTQDAKIDVFTDIPDRSNPLYESNVRQLNVKTNLRGSKTLVSWLQENDDPRLDAYFTAGTTGHYGLWQGWFDAPTPVVPEQAPDVANLSATQPVYFFSKDEVLFMLAEANARYISGAAGQPYYEAATNAACERAGVDCSSLVSGGVYAYPNGSLDENIKAIITQKWASLVYRGYEAFWDQLRTGVPAIANPSVIDPFAPNLDYVPGTFTWSVGGKTQEGVFPKRLIWPESERNTNQNIPDEVGLTVPVWWAQ
jgi:hypothetical protein